MIDQLKFEEEEKNEDNEEEEEEEETRDSGIPDAWDEECATMLQKFAISSELSPFLDIVDLRLVLMAMPSFVTKEKVRRFA